ncbi:MAG TPA: hypothetical protein VIW29_03695 [Polyangiaceae bacterium]
MRTLLIMVLLGAAALSSACTSVPVRVLASEPARAPRAEPEQTPQTPAEPVAPRIGAPGGSGAGSRRVAPTQSENEAADGLPSAGTAVAGRG